ncbi:GrpB family protein (plasmid) [Macrococcus psychrotolerans]|uniref:GrpB family protein n=1 Tax=Macrococcus psychrotolerans TaxID=3039389 RepID=A0AAT9P8H5_9STAP|nr:MULTISPECIES: GrpB family protein [Macrococcus]QYA34001.1 GrpB family protein [Macrococcus sp. 19Msa1099]QYA38787.1 GrpB family protein [Macrococcus caseolyticus]QYA77512.1 GrpB family protein [Macrococcus caseolyticus]
MRKLEIAPYNPAWTNMFKNEAQALTEVLSAEIIGINHIGSTSVPNLYAKPIIDILITVKDISKLDNYNNMLAEMGYEAMGENGISGRRYFQKGRDDRTHHLHVYEIGNQHVHRHLAFKDYLINHPNEVEDYGQLKLKLTNDNNTTIDEYIRGKNDFVQALEERALNWHKNNN